uniref:Uncharacterized protein n=1 Tax=Anopheles albimanus TaxID=7167 RepID=A0A182FZ96_ANOAL
MARTATPVARRAVCCVWFWGPSARPPRGSVVSLDRLPCARSPVRWFEL